MQQKEMPERIFAERIPSFPIQKGGRQRDYPPSPLTLLSYHYFSGQSSETPGHCIALSSASKPADLGIGTPDSGPIHSSYTS